MKTFFTRIRRYPPILCRLLARHKCGPPFTDTEIAALSGLTEYQVNSLSTSINWTGVDVYTLQRFTEACGMDFTSSQAMKRFDAYLMSRPTYSYLRRSPHWKTFYQPLINKWIQSQRQ